MKSIIAVASLIITASLATGSFAATAVKVDGAALLEERCSVCHKADRPKSAKKAKAEWDKTVTRMIGKGAKLSADEKTILIDHLAKTYKP